MSLFDKGRLSWFAVFFALESGLLLGQQPPPSSQSKQSVELRSESSVVSSTDIDLAPEMIATMELGLEFKAIKDHPFRAELVIEIDRRLADGNTLHRIITSTLYRDSKGRIREEKSTGQAESGTRPVPVEKMVMIHDLENRVRYVLFPAIKSGFRMQDAAPFLKDPPSELPTPWSPKPDRKFTSEVLGYQMIERLQCQGRLVTETIPAGTFGNQFPLETATERWFSDELQIDLVIKRRDPRNGETTIRITNLSLEEPKEILFEVPSDYEIREPHSTTPPGVEPKKP